MTEGFFLEHLFGQTAPVHWYEGEPVDRTLLGLKTGELELRGRARYTIQAWRCPTCGHLELTAPSPATSDDTLLRAAHPPAAPMADPSIEPNDPDELHPRD
jgi:hypothetical protein